MNKNICPHCNKVDGIRRIEYVTNSQTWTIFADEGGYDDDECIGNAEAIEIEHARFECSNCEKEVLWNDEKREFVKA